MLKVVLAFELDLQTFTGSLAFTWTSAFFFDKKKNKKIKYNKIAASEVKFLITFDFFQDFFPSYFHLFRVHNVFGWTAIALEIMHRSQRLFVYLLIFLVSGRQSKFHTEFHTSLVRLVRSEIFNDANFVAR